MFDIGNVIGIFATIAWIYVGWRINKLYQQRLDELEEKLIKDRDMEFSDWKRSLWGFLMVVGWPFVLFYESKTEYRQWRYPFCDPDYKRFRGIKRKERFI